MTARNRAVPAILSNQPAILSNQIVLWISRLWAFRLYKTTHLLDEYFENLIEDRQVFQAENQFI